MFEIIDRLQQEYVLVHAVLISSRLYFEVSTYFACCIDYSVFVWNLLKWPQALKMS